VIALRALSSEDGPLRSAGSRSTCASRHLLLDEFQDTSLANTTDRAAYGGLDTRPRTQLVCRRRPDAIDLPLREADVGLFLAAQRDRELVAVALEPLTLHETFARSKAWYDWVNVTFSSVFLHTTILRAGRSRSNRQRRPADRVPIAAVHRRSL